ncbi:MAG: FAD-binding oxidoreductase [Promethearchaeota archaeon]
MSTDIILEKITEIIGSENVSTDDESLVHFSKDLTIDDGVKPKCIVYINNSSQIGRILNLANEIGFSIIPVSSSCKKRYHGDTIPKKENCVILNLSKMNKILDIDRKNRVIMVEPGVTFGELIPILKKRGLRLLLPLLPRSDKSVLSTALEREPITIPKYHWDTSDPLLCTEVYFGTGDLFRTGSAAGPGDLKQLRKQGQAHVNPMGPTQFSPFRVIQGAQGSLGVVTWATLKLELLPSIQKVFHYKSDNINELLEFQQNLIKYRLCDELFILNNYNLASLLKKNPNEIENLSKELPKWNLIYILSGRGKFAADKLAYLEGDIDELLENNKYKGLERVQIIKDSEIISLINTSTSDPWRARLKGGYYDIFFLINLEKIPQFISLVDSSFTSEYGVYIQAINQGTSYHCEFDLFYNPDNHKEKEFTKNKFNEISIRLMDEGAFFNRPYGFWAEEIFKRHSELTQVALKKVKKIFDPNNILNPGVLCFDK